MNKEEKEFFLKEYDSDINDLVELIILYKQDGLNRLKIWKEFKDNGTKSDLVLEAFRRLNML